jgi:DNA-binding LacI/PurR family transcriptional regulator
LLEMGIPTAGLWRDHLDGALQRGFEELALHLESRGIQRVVCLCGPREKLFVTKFKQTLTDTLQEHDIITAAYHCPPDTEAEVTRTIAYELKRDGITAIVASSDKLAINAIHGLHVARLRVPDDCAVVGFGDVPTAQWVQPALTTIRVPVRAMALWATAKVFKEETDQQLIQHTAASCRLIVRRSC